MSAEDRPAWSNAYGWYVLGLLTMASITGGADRAVISVIAEPLKSEFLLSDKQIGILGGMGYSLTFALTVLPAGWLIDRMNRAWLLSGVVAIWSFLTAMGAFASSFTTLLAARMGVGVGEAPAQPASLSLIADIFSPKRRNTAVSIYVAGGGAGGMIIYILGGWLLTHFGWRTVFLVAGGPGLLLAALLFATARDPGRGVFDEDRRKKDKPASEVAVPKIKDVIRSIVGNAALCYGIFAITIATGFTITLTIWTTPFLVRVHGMAVSQGVIWTGISSGVGLMVGALLTGPLADRFTKGDQRKLTLIPIAATFIGLVAGTVMSLGTTPEVSLAGLLVGGLMTGVYIAPGYSILLSLTSPNIRGTTMAVARLVSMVLGAGLIPLFTGAISDAIGGTGSIRPALLCSTALLLPCTFCYVMIWKIMGRGSKDARQN